MSIARGTFIRQLNLVNHLVLIHRAAREENLKGRMSRSALNKRYYALSQAVVVFSVAAWQAYAENVVKEIYDEVKMDLDINNTSDNLWVSQVFSLNFQSMRSRIQRFSTPSSRNVINLFRDCLGFDPSESWNWEEKSEKWKGKRVTDITDFWLKVRHAAAHGSALPKDIRNGPGKGNEVKLDYYSLQDCKLHFRKLVMKTDKGVTSYARKEFKIDLRLLEKHHWGELE